MRIGFIGNFRAPFSTENDRKWSFEKLGHEVIPFQENEMSAKQIMDQMLNLDLLIYSHTHSWEIPMLTLTFESYKRAGIPTASVHLDRWAGLARESDIGKEATWFTQYQFMADFSPEAQELYKKHNLNAHYLRAAVVERDCYTAAPDYKKYPYDIVFVGSKGYHPEYPFRPQMIDFLHREYGSRFGHFGNDGIQVLRGNDLNTLYSTAKVVVGDSCFGGRPNYVSDRYYETRGRGGFLIHPQVKGVDYWGVGFYRSGDLADLKSVIDHYLPDDSRRESNRIAGSGWVKKHETYTHRAKEMLDVIFGSENG